jgi:methylated-DNA-[protein]-cysteine S-methyltransferase
MKPTTLLTDTFQTILGSFSVAETESGAVAATAFGDLDSLHGRLGKTNVRYIAAAGPSRAREQVLAYFAGKRREFDLPLAPQGSVFQQRVWTALRSIPFGATRSYGELARGLASAARAVGRANATNPVCLIVPCHRVIGADGSLTGFAFGEDIKRRLLDHERVVVSRIRAA